MTPVCQDRFHHGLLELFGRRGTVYGNQLQPVACR